MKLSEHTNSETELCGVPAYTHTRSHTHAPPILGKEKKKTKHKNAGDITSSIVHYSLVASPPCAPLLQTSLAQLCRSTECLTCRGKVMGREQNKQKHFQCYIIYKVLFKNVFLHTTVPFPQIEFIVPEILSQLQRLGFVLFFILHKLLHLRDLLF